MSYVYLYKKNYVCVYECMCVCSVYVTVFGVQAR